MLPIFWRYLISHFLKIAFASVLAFVSILLTMRLDEIAHFAALGAPLSYLLLFTLYQIPYILPIALPISCMIGALLTIQRLSHSHEFTALRACGFSLRSIMSPIWLTACFLSFANFVITSELATESHLQANLLKSELRSFNPLLLMQNKHLMRLKGFYFETLGSSKVGESATDVILAIPNKNQQRLNLLIAKNLKIAPAVFIGEGVTIISGTPSDDQQEYDHLFVENIRESTTQIRDFSHLLQKKVWTINNDYLQMSFLLHRLREQKDLLAISKTKNETEAEIKALKKQINKSYSEIIKRISIALAVFSFTVMGTAFGIKIGRRRNYYPLYLAILLTTLFLLSFFIAKGIEDRLALSAFLYLFPHLLIISTSILFLKRIGKGVET